MSIMSTTHRNYGYLHKTYIISSKSNLLHEWERSPRKRSQFWCLHCPNFLIHVFIFMGSSVLLVIVLDHFTVISNSLRYAMILTSSDHHSGLCTCCHDDHSSCYFPPALPASVFLPESRTSSFLCSDRPLYALHCIQREVGKGTWYSSLISGLLPSSTSASSLCLWCRDLGSMMLPFCTFSLLMSVSYLSFM